MSTLLDGRLVVAAGDITRLAVDAIVNAANSSLMGGGGVDGAIHRAGGPAILEACRAVRRDRYPEGLPAGEAVETTGGSLPARLVIHTVGPVWHGGAQGEAETLASCYRRSLELASENGLATIAFPSISTGAYGYPIEHAAPIALRTVIAGMKRLDMREVRFVLFTERDLETYSRALERIAKEPG